MKTRILGLRYRNARVITIKFGQTIIPGLNGAFEKKWNEMSLLASLHM